MGAYIQRGDLTEVFFALQVWGGLYLEGLVFGIYQNMVFKFNTVSEFSPILVFFC